MGLASPSVKQSVPVLQREAASLMNGDKFFADIIFPRTTLTGVSQNGKIIRGATNNMFGDKNANHIRTPGAKYHRQKALRYDSVSYVMRQYASSAEIPWELYEEEFSDTDVKSDANAALWSDLMIRRDRDTAAFLEDYTNLGWGVNDLSGSPGDQFNAPGSNPMKFLNLARKTTSKFRQPNFAVFGWNVHWALRDNDALLTRSPTDTNRQSLTTDELTKVLSSKLDIPPEGIILAQSQYNNAANGQTEDIDPIFGNHVFIGYRALGAADTVVTKFGSVKTAASCARRLMIGDISVREYQQEENDSDVIKGKLTETLVAVNPELGYLIKDAVA